MSWIVVLYFIELELYIYNRYSSFYSSFMVFWRATTPLGRLPINFLLFDLEKCLFSRVVSPLCFNPFAEDWRAGSIPLQSWWLWALMPYPQIRLYVQQFQSQTSLSVLLVIMIFMMFEFIQISQVWVHYFKWFSRVKTTQDEKVRDF